MTARPDQMSRVRCHASDVMHLKQFKRDGCPKCPALANLVRIGVKEVFELRHIITDCDLCGACFTTGSGRMLNNAIELGMSALGVITSMRAWSGVAAVPIIALTGPR